MRIPLDRESPVALYQQIDSYFRKSILEGVLPPGTRLPATRRLARDLGINRITVETAYAELEASGLVSTRIGSGTYVLPPLVLPPQIADLPTSLPLWQSELESRSLTLRAMAPERMVQPTGQSHLINFGLGGGDSRLFPVQDLRRAIQFVLRHDGNDALEYGDTAGYGPLRKTLAQVLASQGLHVPSANVLITSGSQQAIALVAQVLLKPGDVILVESPSYGRGLDLFRALNFNIVGLSTDECGMQVEKLEPLLQKHHPKLIYVIPNFQNPTGACLSIQRRRQLITLAEQYNVPILEDDFVGDLRYEGRAQPALKALDPGGRVIYVSTFSKMLMPGLRVGFLVAEGPVFESLVSYKGLNDLATSNFIQRVLEAYISIGRYRAHLRHSRQVYRKRRDAMLFAIKRCLPADVSVAPPQGGLFLWLRLPYPLSSEELLPLAWEDQVTFMSGSGFFPNRADGVCYLRLNFAAHSPEVIEEGIGRLGKAIRRLSSRGG